MGANGTTDCYILAKSVTYAQRLMRVLQAQGIRARMTKSPKSISNAGCGHAVVVRNGNVNEILSYIVGAGLPPFRIFTTEDGTIFQETFSIL